MLKAYKYRLKPNKSQQIQIEKTFGCCRFIYNYMLSERERLYAKDKSVLSYNKQAKLLTQLKCMEGFAWLSEPSNEALQQSLRNLDVAYRQFFKNGSNLPKFKSKHKSRDSFRNYVSIDIDFSAFYVKIPKIGLVKISKNRIFEGKLKSITVSKSKTGKYYVSCLVETGKAIPGKMPYSKETTVGVDLGVKEFAVLSNGQVFENPKHLRKRQKRIAHLQKKEARQQKGSNRRKKTRLLINKQYEKATNCKENMFHHVANTILSENQAVKIEDLNIVGMMKNNKLAYSIQDASWSRFTSILQYKADWLGKTIIKVPRFFASSKTCSRCGWKNDNLTLKDRVFACAECGLSIDRDENAAINIEKWTPAVGGEAHVERRGYELCEA